MHLQEAFSEFLLKSGHISSEALRRMKKAQKDTGQGIAETITGLGLRSEKALASDFSNFLGLEYISGDWPDDIVILEDISPIFYRTFNVLPIKNEDNTLTVACADPCDDYAFRALEFATGSSIKKKIATMRQLETHINFLYFPDELTGSNDNEFMADYSDDVERLKELATDAPVIRFVDRMIDDALVHKASDIHVEPCYTGLGIRFRVDGLLKEIDNPPSDMTDAIISRIKIMSGLDIAERRLAQDGRMRVRAHGKDIDFRVSSSPTARGEAIVLRLLDKGSVKLDFEALGFDAKIKDAFTHAINKPDGIVLVTGPTGSGKTTTLYTGLSALNTSDKKILTVEDPVEYTLEGLGQVQVENKIGRTFAKTLRSFLRQDPDVIMVGEIRDSETASIAIQASLTGHLVISTLHTNSAAGAIARLMDLGSEGFLVAATLKLIMAQRLVRKICQHCRSTIELEPYFMASAGLTGEIGPFYEGKGCDSCYHSGYAGRTMIAEALVISPEIERAVIAGSDSSKIEAIARDQGMRTMFEHGLEKARSGQTTLHEILRVTRER